MVALVNRYRATHGLMALSVNSGLVEMARRHSARMLAARDVFHSPDLRGQAMRVVPNWELLGENVGMLGDMPDTATAIDWLDDGFRRSPAHNRILIEPRFTQVGVGALVDDHGTVYVTQLFAELDAGGREAAAVRPPVARAAPAPAPARPTVKRMPLSVGAVAAVHNETASTNGPSISSAMHIEGVRLARPPRVRSADPAHHPWLKTFALLLLLLAVRLAAPPPIAGPSGSAQPRRRDRG